jgi:hypothetical protein
VTRRSPVRRRIVSPLAVGIIVLLSVLIFWNLIAAYWGGEIEEISENYTETVEGLVNMTFWVNKGEYTMLNFEAFKGDNLNVSVKVLDGALSTISLWRRRKKRHLRGGSTGPRTGFTHMITVRVWI